MAIRASRGSRGFSQPKITRGDACMYARRAISRLIDETTDFKGMTVSEAVQLIHATLSRDDTFKD